MQVAQVLGMSATRNPYYQLPGGAELPGDVRVSDTPDATKTAAGGWAASPAAVANAVVEMEYGCFVSDSTISDKETKTFNINFAKTHNTKPKSVFLSYRIYPYFYGAIHLDSYSLDLGTSPAGLVVNYVPIEIGNGQARLFIDWLAIW